MIRHGQVGDWRLQDDAFLRSFRLPTAGDKVESLKELHPLARDDRIQFDEASHKYTVDGVLVPLSVTGMIHSYIREFDPVEAISVMKPETRQRYIDQGFATEADIINSWTRNGAVQSSRGTLMHFHIEQYLNGCGIEQPWSPEFKQFVQLFNGITNQRPFRTELSVFSSRLDIAGQIDGLFVHDDGTYVIWDWKRSKILRYDNRTPMREPLDHLPDCNYFHYALQLNIYRYILESEYDMSISGMFLGICHPTRSEPVCVQVPRMDYEIGLISDQRTR